MTDWIAKMQDRLALWERVGPLLHVVLTDEEKANLRGLVKEHPLDGGVYPSWEQVLACLDQTKGDLVDRIAAELRGMAEVV